MARELTERIIHSFLNNYGRAIFVWMMDEFDAGTSSSLIAEKMDLSRQRVSQWRQQFGEDVSKWDAADMIASCLHSCDYLNET
jgi:hypothetical protein